MSSAVITYTAAAAWDTDCGLREAVVMLQVEHFAQVQVEEVLGGVGDLR